MAKVVKLKEKVKVKEKVKEEVEVKKSVSNKSEKRKLELTDKELEIARLIWDGYTTKEIAEQLENSPRTVEVHIHSMYLKVNEVVGLKNNNFICLARVLLEKGFLTK